MNRISLLLAASALALSVYNFAEWRSEFDPSPQRWGASVQDQTNCSPPGDAVTVKCIERSIIGKPDFTFDLRNPVLIQKVPAITTIQGDDSAIDDRPYSPYDFEAPRR